MLEQFLKEFYETISFESGEQFKGAKFRAFFLDNAILIEENEGSFQHKTLDAHIEEFDFAVAEYPQLFINGFHEVQLDYSSVENDDSILVSSRYRKTYSKNDQPVVEEGINNMILVRQNGECRIASILW